MEQNQAKREAMGATTIRSAMVQIVSDAEYGAQGFNVCPAFPLVQFLCIPVCTLWNINVYLMPLNVGSI